MGGCWALLGAVHGPGQTLQQPLPLARFIWPVPTRVSGLGRASSRLLGPCATWVAPPSHPPTKAVLLLSWWWYV